MASNGGRQTNCRCVDQRLFAALLLSSSTISPVFCWLLLSSRHSIITPLAVIDNSALITAIAIQVKSSRLHLSFFALPKLQTRSIIKDLVQSGKIRYCCLPVSQSVCWPFNLCFSAACHKLHAAHA